MKSSLQTFKLVKLMSALSVELTMALHTLGGTLKVNVLHAVKSVYSSERHGICLFDSRVDHNSDDKVSDRSFASMRSRFLITRSS